jgi:hypothetical protein
LSNQGKPQQAKPERDIARRSRAPPPPPARSVVPPRLPGLAAPSRGAPSLGRGPLPHAACMPRCLVPHAARANRARPGGPSAAFARRAGRGQDTVRAGSRGRGRLTVRPDPPPACSSPIRPVPPCAPEAEPSVKRLRSPWTRSGELLPPSHPPPSHARRHSH